ncbi:efflux RND transporter periplasmic adaptor subunit [Bacillus nitratireducens]|uniref:efflux RND transporter periplasmic adaptor subunit n=1 Tax=Bacillus nitratireducens TaxID=2026193 RepID=UPI001BAC3F33|nr:efflux RND transporter periplasmic adaptor subunit [Bacillus nitratireducens]QUG84601.1 efflux RND transporter periplasmic adaptor subunit [Bacillus nitratireducens]
MKKKKKVLLIGVLIAGIGAGTYFGLAGSSPEVAMAYDTYKITEKKIENAQKFGGEVIPNGIEMIAFDLSKGNYELAVKKGDEVKKGQLLFKYSDASIKLEKSESDMQKKLAEKEVALLQKQIDNAKQKLQKDKASGAEKAMLQAAEQEMQGQETQLEMKKFEVEKANQMIQAIKEKTNALAVTSPADGVIEEISKEANGKAGMSGVTIRTAGSLKVKGQLSEYELSQVKVGQEVSITSKIIKDKAWTGAVTEIGTTPIKSADENNTISNYQFVVTLNNSEELQTGFHVNVISKTGEANGTVIPKSSIVKKGDKNVVFIVKDGKAKEQPINIDFETDNEAKVSGVKKDDQIISKPEKDMADGMEVTTQ